MRGVRILAVVLFAIIALNSCKSQYDKLLMGHDIAAKYAMAMDLFEKEKYGKAAPMFESLTIDARGTSKDDTVQYYWALSNYRFEDYLTAESNFNEFIRVFPVSPFTEDAKYYRIDCLYKSCYRYELDQTPTLQTIDVINRYLLEHPDSQYKEQCNAILEDLNERLDKKAFEAARLYYHMEDYIAARHALRGVLKDDAENIYREDVMYFTAMASYKYALNSVESKKKDRYMTFVDDYYNFISEYPESKYVKDLNSLYEKADKIIKKNTKNK